MYHESTEVLKSGLTHSISLEEAYVFSWRLTAEWGPWVLRRLSISVFRKIRKISLMLNISPPFQWLSPHFLRLFSNFLRKWPMSEKIHRIFSNPNNWKSLRLFSALSSTFFCLFYFFPFFRRLTCAHKNWNFFAVDGWWSVLKVPVNKSITNVFSSKNDITRKMMINFYEMMEWHFINRVQNKKKKNNYK